MRFPVMLACAAMLPAVASAYQADLVPASRRAEARQIEGRVTISGADGSIHVEVENVMTPNGEYLDTDRASVHMKLRVNGVRRSITLPMTLDSGDGELISSLGLQPDDTVVVADIRVRGPNRHTLAQAGVVARDAPPTTRPPPVAPPPPSDCPEALVSCQSDLEDCTEDLDECESGF